MGSNTENFIDQTTGSAEGQLRLNLLAAALAQKLSDTEYGDFLHQLALFDSTTALAAEIVKAKNTTYDQTPEINLDTSAKQLLWAVTLLRQAAIASNTRTNITNTLFFRHLTGHLTFQQELLRYAQSLSDHFDRSKTRIRWGAPLSWFYFSPSEKLINLDPFHSLVFGLPRFPQDYAHSRGPALHEVGHALLSQKLPPLYQQTIDRLTELGKKQTPLTTAEQEEILDKRIEAMLWGQFYNLTEDNVVNRFAIILGRYQQGQNSDYAQSLKYIYALINQSRKSFEDFKNDQWSKYIKSGQALLKKPKSQNAIGQFESIAKALGLSVPVNEGLFVNTKTDWERSGLDWNVFMPNRTDAEKLKLTAEILAEGDGTADSISYQQPYIYRVQNSVKHTGVIDNIAKASERFFRYLTADSATIHSPEEIERANDIRNAVIERLWQKYVAPLLPQIKADLQQQLQQQQGQSSPQDMADQIPGPPSSGMGSPSQGQADNQQKPQEQPNDQQKQSADDQHQQDGKSDPPNDDKKQQDKGVKGNQSDKPQTGDQDNQSGQGKKRNPDEKDQSKNQNSSSKDEQPDPAAEGDGQDAIRNDENRSPGQLLRDVVSEAEQQESAAQQRQQRQENQLKSAVTQAQESSHQVKYDFPAGDWSNYQATKQQLAWLTKIFVRQLDDIRKKQIELQIRRGRRLEMLPDGGEMDRLNRESQIRLVGRIAAQAPLRPDDFKRFVDNKLDVKFTTPQIVLLIDGSGSMGSRMNGTAGAAPIDIAISTGLALYEATNQINARVTDPKPAFECYSGIWGPNNPSWLTWPTLESTEAGKNFDRFRKGLQSNTNLAPALSMIPKKLAEKNSPAKNIGATHLLILSDGDIQDATKTHAQVIKLVENIRNITIDILLISAKSNPQIVQVFQQIKGDYPGLNYGVHRIDDLDQLPLSCLKALRQRMTKEILSTPQATKAAEFKRAALG